MQQLTRVAALAVYVVPAFSQTGALQCYADNYVPPLVRAEGRNELLGDLILSCTGGSASTFTVNFTIYLNVPLANRVSNPATGASDAILLVDEGAPAPVLNSNLFQGVISGNQIQFNGIPFTPPGSSAARVLRFANLRAFIASSSSPTVEAVVVATGPSALPIINPERTLAYLAPGLSASDTGVRTPNDASGTVFNSRQCAGQNAALLSNPAAPASVNFNLRFGEGRWQSFRAQKSSTPQNIPGNIYNTESGYSPTGYPAMGAADSGTRLIARFSGVPAGVSLFVTTRPSPAGTTPGIYTDAALTSTDASGGGPYTPIPHTGSVIINSTAVGIAQIPLSNGSGMAVWEILSANSLAIENLSFGVLVAYADSAASLGAAQVKLSLGPVLDYSPPTATSPIPGFVDNAIPLIPFTIQACTPCNSLITPYVALEDYAGASVGNTITVSADPGCNWAASSDSAWIAITQGAAGTGNGTVVYNLAQNALSSRTGHLTVAGHTLTRTQRAPSLAISNGASNQPQGSVAPGEVIALDGTNFGPAVPMGVTLPSLPSADTRLPSSLGLTRVLFDGVPGTMLYTSPNHALAVVPYGVSNTTLIEVEHLGTKRDFKQMPVAPAAPGIFAGVRNDDGLSNWYAPAAPGSIVSVFVTGAGQTNPAGIDGKPFSIFGQRPVPAQSIAATVDGLPAQVVSANVGGYETAPVAVGSTEVRVRIPLTATAGNRPLSLSIGGVPAQANFSVNVGASVCTFSLPYTSWNVPEEGGTYTMQLTTQQGCYWSLASSESWLTITSAKSGTGSTAITFTVAAQPPVPSTTMPPYRTAIISNLGTYFLLIVQHEYVPAPCVSMGGYVWFDSVNYVSASNASSDRLIVGSMASEKLAFLSTVPAPVKENQKACSTVPIAPGYKAEVYVPTAAEKAGDFSGFSGLLLDPLTIGSGPGGSMLPFPGGIIPPSRIPGTMAWRASSVTPCSVSIRLTDISIVPSFGGNRIVAVTHDGCGWVASTNASWISLSTSPFASDFSIRVANNPTSVNRSAQIIVNGQTLTITQARLSTPLKIGIVRNGTWYLDSNGTRSFNNGVDSTFNWWAGAGSTPVTGDWNGSGTTKAAFYKDGLWYLDYDGTGIFNASDKVYGFGWAAPGIVPLVGDWNGDGRSKVAVFYNGFWYLDYNGNGSWDGPVIDRVYGWGWQGVTPLIGDWNGDGRTKIGFFVNGFWYLDYNGNGVWEPALDRLYGWGWNGVTPVVGDWNGDGRKKIGFFINGFWYLDYNGDGIWDNGVLDKVYSFGWNGVTPLVADWTGDGRDKIGIFINGTWYLDFNGTGVGAAASVGGLGQAGDIPVTGRW